MHYKDHFSDIVTLISNAKERAYYAVNVEIINLYWDIGQYISAKLGSEEWGKRVVENLAIYIQQKVPNTRGFSRQNLWRMKQFYEVYHKNLILSPLVRELSWTNNLIILSRAKSDEEKEFYLRLCIKESLSKRELDTLISSSTFERFILSEPKLSPLVRELYPAANEVFKDNYAIDFLALPQNFTEKNLRKSIITNLKLFILEFGKDFTFVGEEYRIQVGLTDFYIDLLFYHRDLQCLVAIDLKTTHFKPEHLGKMQFYLEALDKDVKKPHEKPSVGMVLCKNKDEKVVEYALNRSMSPTLVSRYQTELFDKNLLATKLEEFFNLAKQEL